MINLVISLRNLAELGVEVSTNALSSDSNETGTSLVVVTPDAERSTEHLPSS